MIFRRLILAAILGWTLLLASQSACVSVKAPERITIGDGGHSRDNDRDHARHTSEQDHHDYDVDEDDDDRDDEDDD